MSSLLDKIGKEALIEYLEVCSKWVNFDKDIAFSLAINAIKYYQGNKSVRDSLRILQEAEVKWYKSLESNEPDYSVYNDTYYLSDLWACWVIYSRSYSLSINSIKSLEGKSIIQDMKNINTVVDLGCGFGYTTGALKEYFPTADVFGTNLEDTDQFKIAKEFGKKYNFQIIPNLQKIKEVDLMFASEYFEHIERPIEHLLSILKTNPRYLIIANAFNAISVGHFKNYWHGRASYAGKEISKLFNNTLRLHGFEKVKTTLWNNRPTYWRKIENNKNINRLF
ncbi:MAG: class I SAM-dependent methyltransferase [Candidatus Paceibacterota bacterium]|jgi:SAM-dependent methyltransferase